MQTTYENSSPLAQDITEHEPRGDIDIDMDELGA